MLTYLVELTVRLSIGVASLPEPVRRRHVDYLLGSQREDGGFAGRQGDSDLYYTGFGLRGLAVLGQLEGQPAERAAAFLQGRLSGRESIVDFFSLIYGAALLNVVTGIDVFEAAHGDWASAIGQAMESLRRDDGGYAKGPEGNASSTYHSFLVLLCLELLGIPVPQPEKIVSFIRSQRTEEGGFREIRASKRAGTNPTAAAIGALRILGALEDELSDETVEFLVDMQTDEGGLRANTRIPIADLLSTFTGFVTLSDLGAARQIDLNAALRYVQSMERTDGGFHGAMWDESHDVEYTFYGLGALALLSQAVSEN